MKKALIVVLVVAAAVAAYLLLMPGKDGMQPSPSPTVSPTATVSPTGSPAAGRTVTVALAAQNNSGESGTATLTEVGGKVNVTINVSGEPAGADQPAHIHTGSCPNPGPILHPLTNVKNGRSVTVLDTTLAALKNAGPLAINLHKSAAESSVYVACGNIVL